METKFIPSLAEATGTITYNMTNNYMFRFILQKNQKVLKGLISALLHLNPDDILSVEIQNPIDLADTITGKEFILDTKVMLNDNTLINMEMQVLNEHNWPERSLSYLCRNYDQLYRGQEYASAIPVYHIGFLDFTLFPGRPEFYATYRMLNVKNHHLYSDKLTLSVINLKEITLATEEDKTYNIDYWARLFKANTWEDLKMLAKNNEYLKEAANSIYQANADDMILERCRAREEAERRERTMQRDIRLLTEENERLTQDNDILQQELVSLKQRIAELEATKH